MRFSATLLALGAIFSLQASAHTWIEQLRIIAANGTFTSAIGYPRGNILRTSPLFSDTALTHLLPPNGRSSNKILPSDAMCMPSQAVPGNQTPGSPALTASPGDMIALRYQENGHVTIPDTNPGKPANRGTVYIYGTTSPLPDEKFLSIHHVWNADGTGGDKRGVLLATRNFDDGWCYQVNDHPISLERQKQYSKVADAEMGINLWCQTDVTLPASLAAKGRYTIYWVWDWPTAPSTNNPSGTTEIYTSCMDVNLAAGVGTSKSVAYKKGQDRNHAAIASELTAQFDVSVTAASAAVAKPTTSSVPDDSSPVTLVTITVTAPASMTTVTVTAPFQSASSSSSSSSANQPPASQTAHSAPPPSTLIISPFQTSAPSPTSVADEPMHTVTDVVEETVLVTKTRVAQEGVVRILFFAAED